ncbi:MAG: hypothetical protein WCE33_06400 [Nitrososphaeraceae archaeon]
MNLPSPKLRQGRYYIEYWPRNIIPPMSFRNKPKSILGRVNEGLGSFKESPPGTHCLMVYPDLMTLRGIYSHYTKIQLEDNNEIVLILSYYEMFSRMFLHLQSHYWH